MKSRSRHCVIYTAAALGLSQMPLTARAQFTYLNEFAQSTSSFDPWFVGSGPNDQVVVTDFQHGEGNYYGPDGAFQGSLTKGTGDLIGLSQNASYPTVGSDGNYYVADGTQNAIDIFGSNGVEQSMINSNTSGNVTGIAESSAGNVYARTTTTISVYRNTGQFESSFNLSQSSSSVTQLALDASGNDLYLADGQNNSIDVYSTGGTPEGTFGSAPGPGQMNRPFGVAVSASGLVYVSDANPGIKVYSLNGTYLQTVASAVNGQPFSDALSLAVNPLGMVYATSSTATEVYRFFDPASWVSGTNNFTNPNTGPTSVAVGSGQLLGAALSLNPSLGLNVGATTTVNDGGVLTLDGGTLTTNALVVDGTTNGSSFTMTSGSLTAATINVSNGGVADFAGSPLAVALSGTVAINGPTSQLKVDQGAIFSATGLTTTGQVIVGTAADLIVYASVNNSGTVNLTGGELDVRGALTNPAMQTIQGTGALSTTLGLLNSGTLALSGSSSVLGPLNNSGGTIHLSGTGSNVFYGATTNTGTLTIDAGASGTFYGAYNGSTSSSIIDNGSLYLNANSVSGSISGSGNLTIGSNSSGPAIVAILPNSRASTLATLSLSGSSALDLTNTALVLQTSSLASITALIAEGYNGGKWNGGGITSSAAANNSTHLTALGVIANDNGHGVPLYGPGGSISTTFNGASPTDGNILVAYTYYGDANLDGKVDASDYGRIDNGYLDHLTGWFNGDFNYDGVINGSDYTLIDNAFNRQGALLDSSIAGPAAIATAQMAAPTAVPEPVTALLAALGSGILLGRRSRRRC